MGYLKFNSICQNCRIGVVYDEDSKGVEIDSSFYDGSYYYSLNENKDVFKILKKYSALKDFVKNPKDYDVVVFRYRVRGIAKCPTCGKEWLSQEYYYTSIIYLLDKDHEIVLQEEDEVMDACSTELLVDRSSGLTFKIIDKFPEDNDDDDEE